MKRFKVEAFIVPRAAGCGLSESNQIDDEKLAVRLRRGEPGPAGAGVAEESSDCSGVFFDVDEHIYDEIKAPEGPRLECARAFLRVGGEPVYDEPFVGSLTSAGPQDYDVPRARRARRPGALAPRLPRRSSSLQSISEDVEGPPGEALRELGCRGRGSGCRPSGQRPEDISDDIFKENWMQRLDALRKLETLLRDKEVALQSRERLLFKKEKELRLLERLVRDKMRQAELYARRFKSALGAGERPDPGSSAGSSGSLGSSAPEEPGRLGSARSRPRQRPRFEDLDSTLSADVGDASLVVTSRKFDPGLFRRPLAFTRSASERRPGLGRSLSALPVKSRPETLERPGPCVDALEEKALKKISDNIAASQNQESKLVDYGLIDGNAANPPDSAEQRKGSYLDSDNVPKSMKLKIKSKDRPVSWSEQTDDWLKKKRQAYNMSTKSVTIESTNDKENFDRTKKINKSVKVAKKRDGNQKRFSIFR